MTDGRQYQANYRAALRECEARLEARDRYISELQQRAERAEETLDAEMQRNIETNNPLLRRAERAKAENRWLRGQVEWLEANSVLRNPRQHPISEYLETKDEPEPVCPGSERGVHSEAWYDGERCSTCGAPALASEPADGWKLVPVEPTEEMVAAGKEVLEYTIAKFPAFTCYLAMIAAAPQRGGE